MKTDRNSASGLGLIPASIFALGTPTAPIKRLIGLQSAVARCVEWLANIRLPRRQITPVASIRQATHPGDLR